MTVSAIYWGACLLDHCLVIAIVRVYDNLVLHAWKGGIKLAVVDEGLYLLTSKIPSKRAFLMCIVFKAMF
ncbi:hypothetical protein B296_00042905 [Ensete ventricosum]|uniref:Uncharacterized protein n=1 Tax=Ensete ventricosum TaxID=4639 RepID=A0A426ZGP6_ENSVE|nr:hypothetical protein B296_00042905 [Ensete ventricosum]